MRFAAALSLLLLACGPPAKLSEVKAKVFEKSCLFSTCHAPPGSNGLVYTDPLYEKLVNVHAVGAPDQILVVPFKPVDSYLYQKLFQPKPAAGTQMPPGDVVTSEQLELVRSWIAAGAKND